MNDSLDKVLDIAKKLRTLAKKTNDAKVQDLVTDLNLSLADLKVELVEERQQQQQPPQTQTQTTEQQQQQEPQPQPVAVGPDATDDDLDFTY